MLPAVTLGLSAAGGNTYQLPSSCLKKNNDLATQIDAAMTIEAVQAMQWSNP